MFFALWPDEAVRQRLSDLQSRLAVNARALPPELFHITLAFLGDVHPGRIGELEVIANTADFEAVQIDLDRLGYFDKARVGWVGPTRTPGPLHFIAI